ncbi:hypothetical protein MVEG_11411 [Podila verticillata NRRL 6337]|uniref:Uncharacterized protein n=1 Tax=Podila verticillata NRRL 6337 TaxID=1069443 RepID=A0A086TLR0_9FUNG|nr:hypothetical protein MVEG_11411 [Podila verticillata NRRL 6337]
MSLSANPHGMPESIPFQEPELFRLVMKYSVPAAVNLVLEHYNGVKDDEEDAEESISQLVLRFGGLLL